MKLKTVVRKGVLIVCVWDTPGDRSLQGLRVESGIIGAGKMAQRLRVLSALAENPSSVPCTHVTQPLIPPALEGSFAFNMCGQH